MAGNTQAKVQTRRNSYYLRLNMNDDPHTSKSLPQCISPTAFQKIHGYGQLQYALPLRSTNSYSPQDFPTTSPPRARPSSEHILRRKTPGGTLTDGYDGTFHDSFSQAHASKILLIPSANLYDTHIKDGASARPLQYLQNATKRQMLLNHSKGLPGSINDQQIQEAHLRDENSKRSLDSRNPLQSLHEPQKQTPLRSNLYQPNQNAMDAFDLRRRTTLGQQSHNPQIAQVNRESSQSSGSNVFNQHPPNGVYWHNSAFTPNQPAPSEHQSDQLPQCDQSPIAEAPTRQYYTETLIDSYNQNSPSSSAQSYDSGGSSDQSISERRVSREHGTVHRRHVRYESSATSDDSQPAGCVHDPHVSCRLCLARMERNLDARPVRNGNRNGNACPHDQFDTKSEKPISFIQWAHNAYKDLVAVVQHAPHCVARQAQRNGASPISSTDYNKHPTLAHQVPFASPKLWNSQGRDSSEASWQGQARPTTTDQSFQQQVQMQHSATMKNSWALLDTPKCAFCAKARPEVDLKLAVADILIQLGDICRLQYPRWVDGMLLAGCIAYALHDFQTALKWYGNILNIDATHVEAMSNLAATYLILDHRHEAELYWRQAIKLRPAYFEAVEHLVGLLCVQGKTKDALQIVDYVQASLLPSKSMKRSQSVSNDKSTPTWPPNRYCNATADNGRLISLIHTKGNILYSMHDHAGAAKAYEEVVLTAAGIHAGDVHTLIELVTSRLALQFGYKANGHTVLHTSQSILLLQPEVALHTAEISFSNPRQPPGLFTGAGQLPGLDALKTVATKKAATLLTSNSMLSLAKIFQDAMNPHAMHVSGIKFDVGVQGIIALYYLSLSLQPSPSTANNIGILLATVPSSCVLKTHLPIEPSPIPGVQVEAGVSLALTYYKYGLGLDPCHAHLYTNLGSLLKDIGRLPLAIQMYEKAVGCDGNFDIALANLANALKDQGKTSEAITYYRRAVQANPQFAEAVCGLANALNAACDWTCRGGVVLNRYTFDRWHVNELGELVDARRCASNGTGWIQRVVDIVESQLADNQTWGLDSVDESFISKISDHVALTNASHGQPDKNRNTILKMIRGWKGQAWEGARLTRFIERLIRRTVWIWYQDVYVLRKERPVESYRRLTLPTTIGVPSAPTVLPFHTFTLPLTARQIRQICQRNGLRVSCSALHAAWLPRHVFHPPPPPKPILNIGYVSSDFNNHPLAHLMQSVFPFHDRQRFKAFCYATSASDGSQYRKNIELQAPVFVDASTWSVERLVNQIVNDQIHILINLNGYTRGARNEVFAARPAPIQMAFMGFAGSLGAEWCDYLLADEISVPGKVLRPIRDNVSLGDLDKDYNQDGGNEDWVYGENIVYTKDSFFCCDHRQSGPDTFDPNFTWEDEQRRRWTYRKDLFPDLPDDAIIFGNFNQLYKIDPTIFRTWLRILARLPNAYLWLLKFPADGAVNLRRTALAWAGESVASRIVFTDVAIKSIHIRRACIADLFLDTPECNAHTTAADCLWSGTPLLTLARYEWKMCSRMATSILGSALDRETKEGESAFHDLCPNNEDAYEEMAVRLANGLRYVPGGDGTNAQGRLVDLRKMIWTGRWTCKLFDTRRWVRDLETAYTEAWTRWVEDRGGDIYLKDLKKSSL